MKHIALILVMIFFFSCKKKKMEFVRYKPTDNIILIKNPTNDNLLLKEKVKQFLIENHSKYDKSIITFSFFKYNSDTEYFLRNGEEYSGGFHYTKTLDDYPDDEIAAFIIAKCENDTTKLVGRLLFYGIEGSSKGIRTIDTLIYNCQ